MRLHRSVLPLLVALVVAAFFHKTFLGERLFLLDFFQTFVPLRKILADTWASGFPVWTNALGNGSPVLANPGYGALYPPNLFYLGSDPARSLTLLTVAHAIGGAIGAFRLARRWGMPDAAAWTTAAVFSLCGPAVSATAFPNLSWPYAWLPWALLAHEQATSVRRWPGFLGLAFCWFSMFAAGDPIVLAAAITGSLLLTVRDWHALGPSRSLAPVAIAAPLALTFASPILVAAFAYFPHSVRAAGFTQAGIVQWSLHPLLLAGMILPHPFGDPIAFGPDGFFAAALAADRGRPLLAGLYVGALALSLALIGAVRRSPNRAILLVWLALLLALAFGRYGPIYPLAANLQGFDALRYPTKWLVPAMLPLALLAGWGMEELVLAVGGVVPRRAVIVFLGVLCLLGATSVACMLGLERVIAGLSGVEGARVGGVPLDLHVRTSWLAAVTRSATPLTVALIGVVARARARPAWAIAPVVAGLLTLDLALANTSLAPTIDKGFYDVPGIAAGILADPAGHGRVYVDESAIDEQVVRYLRLPRTAQAVAFAQRRCLEGYVGASTGLALAFNSDTEAFSPTEYAKAAVLTRGAPPREQLMLLGAAGVTHIVTFHGASPIASVDVGLGTPLVATRNPFALRRARVVPKLTPYDSQTGFISAVRAAPDDLFIRTALVERAALERSRVAPDPGVEAGGTATIVADTGRSLTVKTDGPGGFLVVSDTFVPGWAARVDGAPATMIVVDLAFRAVPVPAGAHTVEMRYSPF
jgi:hypothetical protein